MLLRAVRTLQALVPAKPSAVRVGAPVLHGVSFNIRIGQKLKELRSPQVVEQGSESARDLM